jgi:hypothetical protein
MGRGLSGDNPIPHNTLDLDEMHIEHWWTDRGGWEKEGWETIVWTDTLRIAARHSQTDTYWIMWEESQ